MAMHSTIYRLLGSATVVYTERYTVTRAVWNDSGACVGSVDVDTCDTEPQAIALADRDHANDPNGETSVYNAHGAIVYTARG